MKTISREAAENWLKERGYTGWRTRWDEGWPWVANIEYHRASSSMEIARMLEEWLQEPPSQQVLVYVYDPHVWQSSENPYLFAMWCRACGVVADLNTSAGFLFEPGEVNDRQTLLNFSAVAGWGMVAATNDGSAAVHVDNDGHVRVWPSEARGKVLAEWLKRCPGVEVERPPPRQR